MKIITVASLKGGCGKTSLTIYLAQAISHLGARVLVIDLDFNNNLTDYFCSESETDDMEGNNAFHVLQGTVLPENAVRRGLFLDYLPCTLTMATADEVMGQDLASALRFRSRLKALDYDYVLIDTPPALTVSLRAGLYAADLVLSPANLNRWTLQGLMFMADRVHMTSEDSGRTINFLAVPYMVNTKAAEQLRGQIHSNFTDTVIIHSQAIKNGGTNRVPLSQKTIAWELFNQLAQEVMV